MKKRNLFLTLGLALGLGVGVAAGLGARVEEAKKVEATSETTTIYLDVHNSNWAGKGETIYVHYWGGDNASTWPGVAMTKNSFGLYTATVSSDSTGLKFHVSENWGGDCETGDLSFTASKMLWTIDKQQSPCTASSAAYSEKTIYVLDKGGDRLQVNHYAHVYNGSYGTTWPGVSMASHSGHIYSVTIPSTLTTVIWHNNEGNQTANLSIDGVCSVLESDWDGSKWVSLAAAEFIDGFMHFNDISTENTGTTANCAANYSAAKTAYNALASNTIRLEVLSVRDVSARLSAWATANHDTLDTVSGGVLSVLWVAENPTTKNNNTAIIILVVSSIALLAVASIFVIRKRREQE